MTIDGKVGINAGFIRKGDRFGDILAAIVQTYIASGEPVGSQTICRQALSALSPATVRHAMAELEEMGYLTQPHPSAGRLPTDQGFRAYAESLLDPPPLPDAEKRLIAHSCRKGQWDLDRLLHEACGVLAEIADCACVVLPPSLEQSVLKRIRFVALDDDDSGDNRILALLIAQSGLLHSRHFSLERRMSQDELDARAETLNQRLQGLTIRQVRRQLRLEVAQGERHCRILRRKLLETVNDVALSGSRLIVNGQVRLFKTPGWQPSFKLREVLAALEEKKALVHLLDLCLEAEGIQLFFGSECAFGPGSGCAVVAAKFSGPAGQLAGAVAMVGPTRQAYDHVISLVGFTSKLLSARLARSD